MRSRDPLPVDATISRMKELIESETPPGRAGSSF